MLLHATPRSSRSYAKLIPLLAKSKFVIAPDTLGFGLSDPLPSDVTIEQLAQSVVDVLDALEIRQAAIFGLHTGNKIAAALAAGWPDRVCELLLCGMTHSIILDRPQREAAIKAILKANPIDPNKVPDPAERLDRLQGQASVDNIYAANYRFDLEAVLNQLVVPTLVVELATPAEAHLGHQAPEWAKRIPHCATAVIERSDRDVLERVPDELAALILSFLADRRMT